MAKILVVDDERSITEIVEFNLKKEGYETICAYDGKQALALARAENPDLILLDVMLPYYDGFQICSTLRSEGSNVPIIMLTAREEESDKIYGLENGADDYITKPFSMRELLARVRINIRRTAGTAVGAAEVAAKDHILSAHGGLEIDMDAHCVYKNGKALELTQREYELILYLAQQPGKVISREQLMTDVWKYEYYGDLRAIDVTVRRLREKLEDNPKEPAWIMTRRGAGYYFEQ